jgi:hypothetical protein
MGKTNGIPHAKAATVARKGIKSLLNFALSARGILVPSPIRWERVRVRVGHGERAR